MYKQEASEIVGRFLHRRLTFAACICALDAALAALVPNLKPEQLPLLRAVMLANNERLMEEMAKRHSRAKRAAKKRSLG